MENCGVVVVVVAVRGYEWHVYSAQRSAVRLLTTAAPFTTTRIPSASRDAPGDVPGTQCPCFRIPQSPSEPRESDMEEIEMCLVCGYVGSLGRKGVTWWGAVGGGWWWIVDVDGRDREVCSCSCSARSESLQPTRQRESPTVRRCGRVFLCVPSTGSIVLCFSRW